MRKILLTPMALLLCVSLAYADNGVISIKSPYDVKKTADRFENALNEKAMTVFIRRNHAESDRKVGENLRPTELVIFGNPKVGTPLMQCDQSVAIDLPQKALIWQDEAGQVWLTYNDPKYLANRHNLAGCDEVIKKIEKALGNFAKTATMP